MFTPSKLTILPCELQLKTGQQFYFGHPKQTDNITLVNTFTLKTLCKLIILPCRLKAGQQICTILPCRLKAGQKYSEHPKQTDNITLWISR